MDRLQWPYERGVLPRRGGRSDRPLPRHDRSGPAYVATGRSFFTVETHIRYLSEVESGTRLIVTTQLIGAEGKRLHLFHRILRDQEPAATVETLLIHTDLTSRRACRPDPAIAKALTPCAAHSALHAEGTGRFVGQRS